MADRQAEAWVVVTPSFDTYAHHATGRKAVKKIAITKVFQKRPTKTQLGANGIAVKITLNIDEEVFYPIEPKATIDVPVIVNETANVTVEPVEINRTGKALKR